MGFITTLANDAPHTIPYGYVPTEWICILFIVLFSLTTIIHMGQAVHYRLYWLLATPCLCGFLEILGWAARLWSNRNPYDLQPYIMQMTTTIIAPTPLIASNFMILGELIGRLGPCYSRLGAKTYAVVFVSCDIVALVIQALGGAMAATAINNGKSANAGGNVMLGGIAFQFAAITFYMLLAGEFLWRRVHKKPVRSAPGPNGKHSLDLRTKTMVFGLYASSILIYIRSVYRLIELSDGWTGHVIHTQWIFNVFDGAMITLAMFELNVIHPGHFLGRASEWGNASAESAKENIALRSKDSQESGRSNENAQAV